MSRKASKSSSLSSSSQDEDDCKQAQEPEVAEIHRMSMKALREWCDNLGLGRFKRKADAQDALVNYLIDAAAATVSPQSSSTVSGKKRHLSAVDSTGTGASDSTLPPSKRSHVAADTSRKMRLYKGGSEWTMTFWPGTPVEDLIASVKRICGVRGTERMFLQDSEGNNVALSSYIPTGVQLFVHTQVICNAVATVSVSATTSSAITSVATVSAAIASETTVPSTVSSTAASASVSAMESRIDDGTNGVDANGVDANGAWIWRWDAETKQCEYHEIKDGGISVGQSENRGYGKTAGNLTIKCGYFSTRETVAWTITLEPLFCCLMVGAAAVRRKYHGGSYTEKMSRTVFDGREFDRFWKSGNGSANAKIQQNMSVTCVVLPKRYEMWMYRDLETKARIVIVGLPSFIRPMIGLKHKTFAKITSFDPLNEDNAPKRLFGEEYLQSAGTKVITYESDDLKW